MDLNSELSKTLRWRSIGPHRGGRVVAVAGDPVDKQTFYFGACAGGIWKTEDGGLYWENISDGYLSSSSIGALAVSESDPSIIYAGTGEACIRSDVSHGDGVYRSTDHGSTWENIGLTDTRHISRIRIHPKDPNQIYVAALGHAFGPNNQRGIFRTKDAGRSWEHILFKSPNAGAIDLSMDPGNPNILFASIYQVLRTPWSLISAGPESGLWRSMDGGNTWSDITNNPGMPDGIKGRIGVSMSPAKPGRVWTIVEAKDGALLKSDNYGDNWERMNDSSIVRQRPFYHHHIFAHPTEPDTMWTLPIQAWKSEDCGKTFTMMTTPHSDNHDLWIDPQDPQRMIEGNDGGACVSFNGGKTWSSIYNQATAQFYHLTTDSQSPYRVYGTQQDNSAISTPSDSITGAIPLSESYSVGPSESGYIAVHPSKPNIVYSGAIGSAPGGGGALLRYNHETKESRIITVWPEMSYGLGARDMKYRFQWTFPIVISHHNPDILYVAANRVFKSIDEGTTWETISPDLTRNDPEKGQPGGGPISRDVSGAEVYCTIFSLAESYHDPGILWSGSDDGLVHVSRDNGLSWTEVTPNGLPKWATISMIELSRHDPSTVYLAAWNYKLDDYSPYLYRTRDEGKNWEKITTGIPEDEFVRAIREDPDRPGLLFAGCENGIYVSMDSGTSWQSFQSNLPVTPIHDLVIKDQDLIVATHGRSFWILDDLSPLHQLSKETTSKACFLFKPRTTFRTTKILGEIAAERIGPGKNYWVALGIPATFLENQQTDPRINRTFLDSGETTPNGIIFKYYVKEKHPVDPVITIYKSDQSVIAKFSGIKKDGKSKIPNEVGINHFIWDLRYKGPKPAPEDKANKLIAGPSPDGPLVVPGNYSIKLEISNETLIQDFEIKQDPKSEASQQDLENQLELLLKIRDSITTTNETVNQLRSTRTKLLSYIEEQSDLETDPVLILSLKEIVSNLNGLEDRLISTWNTSERGQMGTPLPKLVEALATLISVVESADAAPTKNSYAVFEHLSSQIETLLKDYKKIVNSKSMSTLDLNKSN